MNRARSRCSFGKHNAISAPPLGREPAGWRGRGSSQVEVSIEGTSAVFTVRGADKLWSLRSHLEIPLDHIRDVHADPAESLRLVQQALAVSRG